MTYPNDNPRLDPVPPRLDPTPPENKDNTGMWIAGIVGLCLVIGLVFWAANRNPNTAMTNAPATNSASTGTTTTTGSGATTIPANPGGTAVQRDVPASKPPATNR